MTTITDFGIDFRRIGPTVGEHCCGDRHQVGRRTSLIAVRKRRICHEHTSTRSEEGEDE